ncbi:MAG: hypothetical protein AB1445_02350 [Bacillota bacterium]
MSKGHMPVVVTMSGRLNIALDEMTTAREVLAMVAKAWGIDLSLVDKPFVVVHDQGLNKYSAIEGDNLVGTVDGDRFLARAVLPLKPMRIE